MSDFDYSLYYRHFNQETAEWAEMMAKVNADRLGDLLPEDKGASVLDVGCGWGYSLLGLRRLGFTRLSGVEISAQQAQRARQHGLNAEITDDTDAWLKAHPASFDVILLMDVLEHVPVAGQIPFLKSLHAALRPGGRLILSVPNANSILASRWRYGDFTHWSSFTEHSLEFVVVSAGFARLTLRKDPPLSRWPPWTIWRRYTRGELRKWLVRWVWRQVVRAELYWVDTSEIPLELNLIAVAFKD